MVCVNGEQVMVQGRRQCLVQSKSFPGQWHSIEIDDRNDAVCTCTGFSVRKSCRHAKAIRDWMLGKAEVSILPAEE